MFDAKDNTGGAYNDGPETIFFKSGRARIGRATREGF